jgi:HlyD family secretion protein
MNYSTISALLGFSIGLVACSDSDHQLQGYVEGRYTYAASYTTGYLDHLQVHRGENVEQGQPLFVLDKHPEQEALAEAKATAASNKETLIDMELGERPSEIDAIQEEIKGTVAESMFSQSMYERNTKLYEARAIGKAALDESRATYLHDVAKVKQLQADLLTATLGAREHQQLAQAQKVQAAEADVDKSSWLLSTKVYVAPQSGRVDETFYREGELVPAGQPVLSMLVPSEVKVIFYVPEPHLGQLQVGDTVHFRCDGCQASTAKIDYIASQAEYTPPVLYTQDARKSLVFRVEAAIPVEKALNYHPGQPVDVTLPSVKGSSS